jgi:hypothetical protein
MMVELNQLTFAQLAAAAGMLDRAARHLIWDEQGNTRIDLTNSDCQAAGTLVGLAYMIRPQKVTLP